MKLLTWMMFLVVGTCVSAQTPAPRVTLEHTAQHSFTSKATGRTYDIMISLPHEYETSGKK